MMTVNRLELEADLCKQSFFDFFLRFWQVVSGEQLVPNWHIEILCNELQTAASRVIGTVDPVTLKRKRQYKEYDLIINVPPGSTKSTICSVMFPVWCWLHDPTLRFICGSHTDELSMYLAGLCNRLILSEKFKEIYPQIKLTKTTGHWLETKQGGWRLCTSTNASIIGKHAHIQIIDDPLDPKGSLSEADMKAANNWMDHTLPTRMVDLRVSLLILVMQRLGEDDPTGHKLAKTGGTPIRHICLPAVLLDKTTKVRPRALRRYYIDDLFDPVRLPLEVLKAKENGDMGTYAYAGQYMQNPIPAGGAMFQTSALQIHKAAPKMIRMVRYWDKAGCLIKGTKVETLQGAKFIEDVHVGDLVRTRGGWRKVQWAGETAKVDELVSVLFSDGSIVSGTGDHQIWSINGYWVDLASIGAMDYVYGLWQQDHHEAPDTIISFTKGFASGEENLIDLEKTADRGKDILKPLYGMELQKSTLVIPFTGQCGGKPMGIFPVARIYTTRMKTTITMRWETLNVLRDESICSNIGISSQRQNILLSWLQFKSWEQRQQKQSQRGGGCVANAERVFGQTLIGRNIAAPFVSRDGKKIIAAPVYDLTVESDPEFFANGILVHNSGGKGAWTVGLLMGVDRDGCFWVLDVVRGQWEAAEREKRIFQTAKLDGRGVLIGIEQEPGSGGKESAQASTKMLAGYRVRVDRPVGDKVLRADPFAIQVNRGNVRMLAHVWASIYLNELQFFPHSKFKDQVDASSGAFACLTSARFHVGAY